MVNFVSNEEVSYNLGDTVKEKHKRGVTYVLDIFFFSGGSLKALFPFPAVIIIGLGLAVSSIGITMRYQSESQKMSCDQTLFLHQDNCIWFLVSISGMIIMNDIHQIWPACGTN